MIVAQELANDPQLKFKRKMLAYAEMAEQQLEEIIRAMKSYSNSRDDSAPTEEEGVAEENPLERSRINYDPEEEEDDETENRSQTLMATSYLSSN